MRKTLVWIICIFIFFSTKNVLGYYDNYWYDFSNFEELYGIENNWYSQRLENINCDYYNFKNSINITKQSNIRNFTWIIKQWIIQMYELWTIDEYKMNSFINDYETYIYYTNQFLANLYELEKYPNLKYDSEFQFEQQTININLSNSIRDLKNTYNF